MKRKQRTVADVQSDLDNGRKLLKVDVMRCYVAHLQERLARGEIAMQGRTQADVEKAIRLYGDIVSAVDSGDADRAYAASWKAASWSVNAGFAPLIDTARKQISGARRGGKAKRIPDDEKLQLLAEWESRIADYLRKNPHAKQYVACRRCGISERDLQRYRKLRTGQKQK